MGQEYKLEMTLKINLYVNMGPAEYRSMEAVPVSCLIYI